jgi:hypothetical protein
LAYAGLDGGHFTVSFGPPIRRAYPPALWCEAFASSEGEGDQQAERQLQDLKLALPLALERLASAEKAHRAAIAELRRAERIRLTRERIEAAAEVDKALADFSEAWTKYAATGIALYSASSDFPNQVSLGESYDGLLRLAASLPPKPFLQLQHRLQFANVSCGPSLAEAEADFWGLPAGGEEVKAA